MSVFFLGSWGMNRSAEQTNHPRTASRFTRFVCPALRFIPHEPRKKDTHSLNISHLFFNMILKLFSVFILIGERTLDQCIRKCPIFGACWMYQFWPWRQLVTRSYGRRYFDPLLFAKRTHRHWQFCRTGKHIFFLIDLKKIVYVL